MRVVIFGPPGAGKGTQAEWLTTHLSVPHLSTGEMLREVIAKGTDVGRAAQSYIDDGKLVPNDLVIQIVDDRLKEDDCRAGFLLDGFPRTLAQAETLNKLLDAHSEALDMVIDLAVPNEILNKRLLDRGRTDDAEDVIQKRFEVFQAETKPLLEHYDSRGLLRSVDGTGTRDEVRQRIRQLIDQHASANND